LFLDVNKTVYSVTLSYVSGGIIIDSDEINLNWICQNQDIVKPTKKNGSPQNFETNYYDCNTFSYFIDLVNNTFQTAFNNLNQKLNNILDINLCPIMIWDDNLNKADIFVNFDLYNSDQETKIVIYFNNSMYALFNSFNMLSYNSLIGKNYSLIVKDYLKTVDNNIDKIKISQSFSTIDTWTNINSIVFTSSTLPVVSSLLSTPHIIYNNEISNANNASNFDNIVTDLITNQQNFKPQVLYNPTAEFRQLKLFGTNPLYDINIRVMLKLKTGQLIPFVLPVLGSFSMKILFTKITNI